MGVLVGIRVGNVVGIFVGVTVENVVDIVTLRTRWLYSSVMYTLPRRKRVNIRINDVHKQDIPDESSASPFGRFNVADVA